MTAMTTDERVIKATAAVLASLHGSTPCSILCDYDSPCSCAADIAQAVLDTLPAPQAQAVAGWQDISTAPKDGTRVLVAAPGHLTMIGAWLEKRVTYMEGKWWSNNAPIIPDPTHWRPLPAPPALVAEQSERN